MPKRIKVAVGDFFLIPRIDGAHVLGQVIDEWFKGIICIAIYDILIHEKKLPGNLSESHPMILSMLSVGKAEISGGYWQAIGSGPLLADPSLAPHYGFKDVGYRGAGWHSGKIVENFVDAYYGLGTWEPYPGRIGFLKSLLFRADGDWVH